MIPDPVVKVNPEGYYETRCILKVTFDDEITVLVSHFGLNDDEQKNAVSTVLSGISNQRCILLGDFNFTPDNDLLSFFLNTMSDVSIGYCDDKKTWPSYSPCSKIDYILVTKDIIVETAKVSTNIVSDHLYHFAIICIQKN